MYCASLCQVLERPGDGRAASFMFSCVQKGKFYDLVDSWHASVNVDR